MHRADEISQHNREKKIRKALEGAEMKEEFIRLTWHAIVDKVKQRPCMKPEEIVSHAFILLLGNRNELLLQN